MPNHDITLTIDGDSYGLTYIEATRVLGEIAAAFQNQDLSREIEFTPLGKEADGAIRVTVGSMSNFTFDQQVSF
jgi:hypothetical protein